MAENTKLLNSMAGYQVVFGIVLARLKFGSLLPADVSGEATSRMKCATAGR